MLVLLPYILRDMCQSPDRFPSGVLHVWQFRPEFVATIEFAIHEVKKIQRHEFHPPANSHQACTRIWSGLLGNFTTQSFICRVDISSVSRLSKLFCLVPS